MTVTEVFIMLTAALSSCSRIQFSVGSRSGGPPRCTVGTLQSHLLEGAGTVCVVTRLRPEKCVVPVPERDK